MTNTRPPRADAIRNRTKILDAARNQITLHGPNVGMTEIAAAAGVAVGTLYRHFPNKADLVAAVIAEYTAHVADDAEAAHRRAAAGSPALCEITTFLGNVVEASATNHGVKAAAHALGAYPTDTTAEQRASTALAKLIEHGKAEGQIHPDITVDDIYLLVATAPTDQPPAVRTRWLALVLTGLTTQPRAAVA
ncbi:MULTISPECIES: TetR/AcrR family transcriptional regulator [Micromonospora]|uniref:TetR/AcrR family transcriptional regulator n=1 Tax=Micromonospora TaxID=1873 RepID=UPI0011987038|nr:MULTISPECIES: TetR/AcrR family transcriptional regulator [unclassified Micromonospora]QDY07886.1 TetR/AcrR family transcriptional regulator [Micromonospora sp. HM134]